MSAPVRWSVAIGHRNISGRVRVRAGLSACAALLALPALAADVVSVAPANLSRYLQSHPQAVIQFTSTDRNCGFCGPAADAAFDDAARQVSADVSFARVQWTPWSRFPRDVRALGINAIPTHDAFRNGERVDAFPGRMANAAKYVEHLKTIFPSAFRPPAAALTASDGTASPLPSPALQPPRRRDSLIVATAPGDGGNPVADCSRFMAITDRTAIPWSINGADATFCGQTAIGFYPPDYSAAIAAFRGGALVALREDHKPSRFRVWGSASADELAPLSSGHTDVPGELWWGLIGDARHVAVGQQTFTRYLIALQGSDVRRAIDLLAGRVQAPFPSSPQTAYRLVDATPITSARYLGGNDLVANGELKGATLTVATRDPIHGELGIDFEIEGVGQHFVLPLKRNLLEAWPRSTIPPEAMNQLVSGIVAGDAVLDCVLTPPAGGPRVPCTTAKPNGKPGQTVSYELQVAFFGAHSDFAVATFALSNLSWIGTNGSRSFGTSKGLIVFRSSGPPTP